MISRHMGSAWGIRGRIGGMDPQWDLYGARALGAAYVALCELQGRTIVVGHDLRTQGRELAAAFVRGAASRGADVVDLGLTSLDQTSYTAGVLEVPGVHIGLGPSGIRSNGLQFLGTVRPDQALRQRIINEAARIDEASLTGRIMAKDRQATPGTTSSDDTRADYIDHLRSLVGLRRLRPLTVVLDSGNGVAAHLAPSLLRLPGLRLVQVNHPLDEDHNGALEAARLQQARRAVLDNGADLAVVLDADASRCAVLDERGEQVGPGTVAALLAPVLLAGRRGPVVVDTLVGNDVSEVVLGLGCTLRVCPVGERHVSRTMAIHDAVLGLEHDGHWHVRDLYGASSGLLTALAAVALVGRQVRALSTLAGAVGRHCCSGELTLPSPDPSGALRAVEHGFRHHVLSCEPGEGLVLRGIVTGRGGWWASFSQDEECDWVRLAVEADDRAVMEAVRDDLCSIVLGYHMVAA